MENSRLTERKEAILVGDTALGIELGSTRIKAVLIGVDGQPIAVGDYEWENKLVDNIWTYSLEDIWTGVQGSYAAPRSRYRKSTVLPHQDRCHGVSAMMHGYMPFDKEGNLLVPPHLAKHHYAGGIRGAERTVPVQHSPALSIAHLYQAILNGEEHVADIDYLATLRLCPLAAHG